MCVSLSWFGGLGDCLRLIKTKHRLGNLLHSFIRNDDDDQIERGDDLDSGLIILLQCLFALTGWWLKVKLKCSACYVILISVTHKGTTSAPAKGTRFQDLSKYKYIDRAETKKRGLSNFRSQSNKFHARGRNGISALIQ